MDSPLRTAPTMVETTDDLSALAWVHDELRRSLDAAHKALRRFLKEAEALGASDVDTVDPSVLRGARAQFHQGVGALELIGLPAAATVLRASETAVQHFATRPGRLDGAVVDTIEHASFALLDYLSRMLAGKTVSPLAMFPQYRAVLEMSGVERVHPADLCPTDWRWLELPHDPLAVPRAADARTRAELEAQLLGLMRGGAQPRDAAARMGNTCAGLGATAGSTRIATLWKLASAVFEAQAQGLLGFDVFSKRVASRLLAQYRALERGEGDVSDRLAQDLLFFCAQAESPGDGRRAPRLAAVRQAYELVHHVPVDYTSSALGRFDPAWIAQARKRVVAAKESWSGVAGGEMHRLAGLAEQFALVGDSLKRLFPFGDSFAGELQQAVAQVQQSGNAPPAPLAMEVATSLLYIEAALEDAEFDQQGDRVQRLAARLEAVRQGRPSEPLEAWMEELYRRVSDRQTMGSVVQELRASLSEAEKLIDQFFRDPAQRQVLIPVPNQLASMRGVLSVLGMDHASAALLRMRDEIDGLVSTEVEPERVAQAGVFDRLAGNLGALGFLIDMLSVQPQMAKSLFRFDAASGTLAPVMGRGTTRAAAAAPAAPAQPDARLVEQAQLLATSAVREDVATEDLSRELDRLAHDAQAADQAALASTVDAAREALGRAGDEHAATEVRSQLSQALGEFVSTASGPIGLEPLEPARPLVSAFAPLSLNLPSEPAPGEDDEMREVFLEEAREVLHDAGEATAGLGDAPHDLTLLTTVRRAFHTLKGSSRMVGLKEFGEAAWACEQLYNTQLADHRDAEPALLDFTRWALAELSAWVDEIAAGAPATHEAARVQAAAQAVAQAQAQAAAAPESDIALPLGFPPDLPSAADLDLGAPAPLPALPELIETPEIVESIDAAEFAELAAAAETVEPAAAPEPVDVLAVIEPPADEGLDFELDLGALDADALTMDSGLPDLSGPALMASFDESPPTGPLPLPVIEAASAELPAIESIEAIDLDLGAAEAALTADLPLDIETIEASALPDLELDFGASEPLPLEAEAVSAAAPLEDDQVKLVGPLRIGIPLFNIYLNEADELSRRLTTELAEWAMELHRPVGETPIALAHSLAGSSATVGFTDLSQLARSLEHAQMRSQAIGHGTADEARLFVDVAEEIRRLLHQFAAGFLKEPAPELLERLAEHEISSARRLEAATAAAEFSEESLLGDFDDEPDRIEPLLVLEPEAAAPGAGFEPEESVEPVVEPMAETITEPITEATAESISAPEAPTVLDETAAADAAMAALPAAEPAAPHSDFSPIETRFDPLGLTELKSLEALSLDRVSLAPANADRDLDLGTDDDLDDIDAVDAVDDELFPIFEEEGQELLPQLGANLRDWARRPADAGLAAAAMRTLHTLKGGARLAGAMRLGEMAHRLETRIEHLLREEPVNALEVDALQARGDGLARLFEAVRSRASGVPTADEREAAPSAALAETADRPEPIETIESGFEVATLAPMPIEDSGFAEPEPEPEPVGAEAAAALADVPAGEAAAVQAPAGPAPIDWSRFTQSAALAPAAVERAAPVSQGSVRVRAPLLDRLVNQAGEAAITRSRIESRVGQIKGSVTDLTENLERLRLYLRDIELQAETQMSTRLEAAKAASQAFDPLEFDRFTRFQELTRMMAESVNDVATVQRSLQRSVNGTEDELVAQARLMRDLQDDLLRTRMVEFEHLSDRLYRVVRQAAKETGKQVRLDIVGGSIEVDRGVLDRMTGAFEHLLRNSVTHGIESPEQRSAAGKDPVGTIIVAVSHEGNEVGVEVRDDGAGLKLDRIRAKGLAMGLIAAEAAPSDAELANLIFTPGFTTAESVSELAGRGVGMDVVRSEVNALGGRIETATSAGQGSSFKLVLPLTTAVTQIVMLRCGETTFAVPSTVVEIVRRATPAELDAAYASASYTLDGRTLQFFWLGALLQTSARSGESGGRTRPLVVIRSAQQRIAVHVDEVIGNQEVVVKNLGPQLSRLPGLVGMTLLASGAVALIYNPVALATLYGDAARAATFAALHAGQPERLQAQEPEPALAPLVLVVDDSLTVRRVTQRLLVREGYRVVVAKDGMDALERLAEEKPRIVLSDIEMPRMDGFDLVRNIRGDASLRDLPVIMITSRIAQKHRDYAAELGVDHYLGKPYSEEDLLALVGRYTAAAQPA